MKTARALMLAISLALGAGSAGAFTLEPISTLIASSGPGSVVTFRVKSDSTDRVAIRFRVLTRDLSTDGKEINGPADDLFLIYPSRIVVEPETGAAVKVQWRGPGKLDAERCFRFVAEQVPLESGPQQGSGIRVMFRYIASLYVGDLAFSPVLDPVVVGAAGPEGQSGYLVEIRNAGTRHVIAIDPRITLEGGGTVTAEALGELSGANYLPGRTRRIFIPNPQAVAGRSYAATIEYDPAY